MRTGGKAILGTAASADIRWRQTGTVSMSCLLREAPLELCGRQLLDGRFHDVLIILRQRRNRSRRRRRCAHDDVVLHCGPVCIRCGPYRGVDRTLSKGGCCLFGAVFGPAVKSGRENRHTAVGNAEWGNPAGRVAIDAWTSCRYLMCCSFTKKSNSSSGVPFRSLSRTRILNSTRCSRHLSIAAITRSYVRAPASRR